MPFTSRPRTSTVPVTVWGPAAPPVHVAPAQDQSGLTNAGDRGDIAEKAVVGKS